MGIPKFFRWLSDRYPLINQRLDETQVFDHFYLDMNGIIHQCTHPNDDEVVAMDEEAMFARIFHYTDRLFRIVKPSSLLFLAVDGVAPRAKMNQQRSRRFRSAKDAERNLSEAIARGDDIPDGTPFDSNCITPGTKFMADLSDRFRGWIHLKMETDPAWQCGCSVVFSGAEVPGEGEHKIMDYIRSWQASEAMSPATRHCMYGLDADLIMLGLVTHAPHFTLLREKVRFRNGKRRTPVMKGDDSDANEFQLLEIAMLRDMLYLEFKPCVEEVRRTAPDGSPQDGAFVYQVRRVVDDFVFMCMLVGNDFVPNLPHLDIAEGALSIMFRSYKVLLPRWRGYLTLGHKLHSARLEQFLSLVSQSEPQYFRARGLEEGLPAYVNEATYRSHYYAEKLNIDPNVDIKALTALKTHYLEGLHWVLQYYHQGCSSWNWFYPAFYAPLASDMKGLRSLRVKFVKGRPFPPVTQLLAVLPPESSHFLPRPFQALMVEESSPVIDFFPPDFEVDQNGKRNTWEAVVLIPFIDAKRLLASVAAIDLDKELTLEERARNRTGRQWVYNADAYPTSDEEFPAIRASNIPPPSGRQRGVMAGGNRAGAGTGAAAVAVVASVVAAASAAARPVAAPAAPAAPAASAAPAAEVAAPPAAALRRQVARQAAAPPGVWEGDHLAPATDQARRAVLTLGRDHRRRRGSEALPAAWGVGEGGGECPRRVCRRDGDSRK
ncbi:hypothetical protein MMPV_000404 [Pyropia vietnamensis]